MQDAAREAPRRPALVAPPLRWTYAELAAEVAAETARLEALGARGAARVAFAPQARPASLVRLLALIELGVPAVLLPRGARPAERAAMLAAAAPALDLDAPPAGVPAPRTAPATTHAPPDDGRPLAVVFTSGTSAAPKGVVLSRSAFVASAAAHAAHLGWRPDDRWLLCLPPARVGGLSVLTRCLLARAPVVLSAGTSGAEIADALDTGQATIVSLVPELLERLLALDPPWRPHVRLRAILLGGAPASAALLERAAQRRLPVLATYGLTETCSQVATQEPGTPPSPEQGCGRPLPGISVRIVDGAIQVRGPVLLSGYLPAGAHPHPVTPDGWLLTQDLGALDAEGRLHVHGRADEMIVTAGEKVAPGEVERALEQCPGIARALVFGVAGAAGSELVAALLVPGPDLPPSDAELLAALGRLLPRSRIPRLVAYVAELPAGPAGKPRRGDLAARYGHRLRALGPPR